MIRENPILRQLAINEAKRAKDKQRVKLKSELHYICHNSFCDHELHGEHVYDALDIYDEMIEIEKDTPLLKKLLKRPKIGDQSIPFFNHKKRKLIANMALDDHQEYKEVLKILN